MSSCNHSVADDEMQKFIFDGNVPRHRQSTVSSTSKSAAAMLTARVAQSKLEGWKLRLQHAQAERGEHTDDKLPLQQQQRQHNQDGVPASQLTDGASTSAVLIQNELAPHAAAAEAAAVIVDAEKPNTSSCNDDADADASHSSSFRSLAAEAADAAAGALAVAAVAATAAAATQANETPSSLDHVPTQPSTASASSGTSRNAALPARQSPLIKLGSGGARTFSGTAPHASPLRIRLPVAPPATAPSSALSAAPFQPQLSTHELPAVHPSSTSSSSSYVSTPFGSSLRRVVTSSPGSKTERASKPSPSQHSVSAAASTSMDRISAPTIASEMRSGKSAAQADAGGGGSSRPIILGFRDAFALQKRAVGTNDGF